ncbi:MAG: ATP-binding cassette domain-containing protein [Lachnospiraceae bacterium]|nr:ATP-binding cassette domain-containing protein [Lachnospiraceae bacterium]
MSGAIKNNMVVTIFDADKPPYKIRLGDFNKNVITFGRQQDCDIVLTSDYASRVHGRFILENGRCGIEDLNSTNGLNMAGKQIKKSLLVNGDYVRIVSGVKGPENGVLFVISVAGIEESWASISLKIKNIVSIGRDKDNDICLNHVSISHKHAYIVKREEGTYVIDNRSTNGVYVNGQKVSKKRKLVDKDVIIITNSKLVYTGDDIAYNCPRAGIGVLAKNVVKKVGKNQELTICDNVTTTIQPGELVAIVGGSGAGKSTLMNCISGYSKPTTGQILVNDVELYENFDALKHIIGYVPQQDIVYDNLTVYDMLKYSAQLRLPSDIAPEELDRIIIKAIDTVELSHRKDALVKSLSGGQRKRTSIAVELLTDPNLFFLDEPASGLDPGTERSLIRTLKGMTVAGKTVILVTHSTLNMKDYDKIIFMGTGGKLCFSGTHDEALRFFQTNDIVNVYEMIGQNPDKWHQKYIAMKKSETITGSGDNKNKKDSRSGVVRQFKILSKRYMHLLLNDRQRMILLMIQAPLLAVLISIVANGKEFSQYEMTKSLLFALSCSAFWIGILSSIQEICKERNILKREYMTGLSLVSYIMSKVVVLSLLCLIQAFLIVTTFSILVGLPKEGVIMLPYLEVLITTLLTAMAAAAMGIFVSSLFTNADRAMTVAPILLMPQILFSGLIFKLEDASEAISYFAVCRWSMEGYGTTANLNDLDLKMQEQGFMIDHEVEDFFEFTSGHMLEAWGILILFIFIFSVSAGIVLRSIKKNN